MNILKNYYGKNPLILNLKRKFTENPQIQFSDFEREYVERNYMYCGHFFSDLSLVVGRRNEEYLQRQFKTDKPIKEIKVDFLWGESKGAYHFNYKKHSFFLYKDDCENPFDKEISLVPFDVTKYTGNKNKWGLNLFDYQVHGIKFMLKSDPAFCWDEQGVGKTLESIVAAIEGGYKKILVMTLASLKINWRREIDNFHEQAKIISGSEWNDSPSKFTIINYEILKNFVQVKKGKKKADNNQLLEENFDCVIIDEVHKIKNPKSIQSTCANLICKNAKKVIALSGTPIEKNIDFYNICRVLGSSISDIVSNSKWYSENVEKYREYAFRYCNAFEQVIDTKKQKENKEEISTQISEISKKHKRYKFLLTLIEQYGKRKRGIWNITVEKQEKDISTLELKDVEWILNKSGFEDKRKKVLVLGRYENGQRVENTNSVELNQRIKHIQIRRTKKEVFHNFPEKYSFPIYYALTPKEIVEYRELWAEYLSVKNQNKYTDDELEKMSESIKVRQFLAKIKAPHTLNFIENKIENGQKAIVFTHFKEEFELILEGLGKKAVGIKSSMSPEKKQEVIDKFQKDENILAIVGNIKTLGTGHNLTKGDIIVFNSPDWNSGEHEQGEDRAYRLGRDGDVDCYYCLFEGTHEEEVYQRSLQKRENKQTFLNK